MDCPSCGYGARPNAIFCESCGTRLESMSRGGERRQLTVMFWLRARRGDRDGPRRRLGSILGRFREGFDTPDLRDAKALLEAPS